MEKDRLLVTLVLLAVMSAGCVAGSQPMTPASTGDDTTTTDDSVGALAVNETNTTGETATETATTETATEPTQTATETQTATPTQTTTMTPQPTTTEIPLDPPADLDWSERIETVGCDDRPGEKEKLVVDISFTNTNEYEISVGTGLQLIRDDGSKISVGGDSTPSLEPGATWETSFSYESDCNDDLDNIAEINVANQTDPPAQTNPGH